MAKIIGDDVFLVLFLMMQHNNTAFFLFTLTTWHVQVTDLGENNNNNSARRVWRRPGWVSYYIHKRHRQQLLLYYNISYFIVGSVAVTVTVLSVAGIIIVIRGSNGESQRAKKTIRKVFH